MLADACWAISYFSAEEAVTHQTIVESGALPKLINLLKHKNLLIVTPSLQICGSILAGEAYFADSVLNSGFL